MTSTAAGAPPAVSEPDVGAVVATLLPDLRAAGRTGLRWMALIGAAGVAAPVLLIAALDESGVGWAIGAVILAVVAGFVVYELTARRQAALVMPGLARMIGLSYRQNDRSFLDALPERLLPRAARKGVDDVVEGVIGGRTIRFGELTLATGGKNSRTLFRGIVAAVPNVAPLPPFFLAVESETRGWFGFAGRIDVGDLTHVRSITSRSSEVLGVWTVSPADADAPALAAVLDVLTGLAGEIGESTRLYSASSDGRTTHVALRFDRDLFSIGNPFAGDERLVESIRSAFADLSVPVRVVSALLRAEAAVAGGDAGQGR